MKSSHFLGGFVTLGVLSACGPMNLDDAPSPPVHCSFDDGRTHSVDPFKELLIVDDAVVENDAAKNATDGPLGFRHAVEALAGSPGDAAEMTRAWLEAWAPPPFECAWLHARSENACDSDCGTCAARELDLSAAPFRLMAVANRLDLMHEESGGGEGRLLFAATDGPGDDPASPAVAMSVIFEFRLRGDSGEWATEWHALGASDAFDAEYMQKLTNLASNFADAPHLAQIRVDDELSDPAGRLLEFHFDPSAPPESRIASATLARTPPHSLDGSAALSSYLETYRSQVLADNYQVPDELLASSVERGQRWTLPGIDEPLRHAFAAGTCDGCHGSENATIDGGFHVSPFRRGAEKLSRFLFNPFDRKDDELTRRADSLRLASCVP